MPRICCADLRHVQALLGHRSLATITIYTRVAITELRLLIQKCHPRDRRPPRRPRGWSAGASEGSGSDMDSSSGSSSFAAHSSDSGCEPKTSESDQ
jgi:integrase/recombinase XerD